MSETSEVQWQPAILITVHGPVLRKECKSLGGKKYRVRPVEGRDAGRCQNPEGAKFFQVHPEDLPESLRWGMFIVCEHEILTD